MAAGVPGADLVPESAQLFLGFTSTQKDALGPRLIANHETLGYVELGPKHYFRQGTHMHVSHLFEDLTDRQSRGLSVGSTDGVLA